MKKSLFLIICAVLAVTGLAAQEISEKQEVAVFSLSYSDWSVPSGALSIVDQQIVKVIANLGRFDVKGLDFRLKAQDVADFVEKVKQVNEANAVIDEKYRLGEATFTEADFQELVGSFIIVIPSLTFYDSSVEAVDGNMNWEVELQTAFSFIKVRDSSTLAHFTIKTYGSGGTQKDATLDAAEAISSQLEFELRNIEEFRLKSGIIEVLPGGNVIIQLGSNMGLEKGDEFSIVEARTLDSGHTIRDNTGLLVISEVKSDVSFGHVIYNDNPVAPGDQLTEIPRLGTDVSVYTDLFIGGTGITGGTVGVMSSVARGFYDFRPFVGLETPLVQDTLNSVWPGFPLTLYGGGELLWYIGRLQVEPSIALGGTGLVPVNDSQNFIFTHIGGKAGLAVNWMFSDNFRLFLRGGYSYWVSLSPSLFGSYGGIFGGIGVTFKI